MAGFRRILFATDFSDGARAAWDAAAAFARAYDVKVHVVHALVLHEADLARAEAELPKCVPEEDAGLVSDRKLVRGLAAEIAILREARDAECDLICIGTHGRSGLPHVLLGSVAERVVQLAGVPVLTVRSKEHHFQLP